MQRSLLLLYLVDCQYSYKTFVLIFKVSFYLPPLTLLALDKMCLSCCYGNKCILSVLCPRHQLEILSAQFEKQPNSSCCPNELRYHGDHSHFIVSRLHFLCVDRVFHFVINGKKNFQKISKRNILLKLVESTSKVADYLFKVVSSR